MPIKTTKILTGGRHRRWRASLGLIDAVRPTKSEAIYALCDTIEDIISGSYEPDILSFGPLVTVVYRDITGWQYRVDRMPIVEARHSTVSLGRATRTEAIRLARRHMVQMAYPITGLVYLESAGDLAGVLDQAHWLGFQRAYERAKAGAEEFGAEGEAVSESELHRIACVHADDPDLIEPQEREIVERVRNRVAAGG